MKPIEEDARRQLSLKLKSKFYGRCMTYLLCSINSDDSLYNGGVLTSQPTLREWTSQIRAKTHTHTHTTWKLQTYVETFIIFFLAIPQVGTYHILSARETVTKMMKIT